MSDGFNFNFPRPVFVDKNGIAGQLLHVGSEHMEAMLAMQTPDIEHTAEEVMDLYHSAETALRILAEKYGIDLDDVRDHVIAKNRARGYYS